VDISGNASAPLRFAMMLRWVEDRDDGAQQGVRQLGD
jgi:hypothetical protein